jgi:hypothetical protein
LCYGGVTEFLWREIAPKIANKEGFRGCLREK